MVSLLRRCVTEALGTFTLVVIGPGAAMVAARTHAFGQVGVSLAFGLAVTLIVASSGHLSGAHVNPAVTIGFWSVKRFRGVDLLPYICAQCAGAVLGSLLCGWLIGPVASFGATLPSVPLPRAFVIEMGYSGLLAFVIMSVATDDRAPAGVAPFAIGATVFAGALVTGPLTGGSFNPARSLGPAVASGLWNAHWLYWLAPIVGMIAGMSTYELCRGEAGVRRRPPARRSKGRFQPCDTSSLAIRSLRPKSWVARNRSGRTRGVDAASRSAYLSWTTPEQPSSLLRAPSST